jgi:hypothetical protein
MFPYVLAGFPSLAAGFENEGHPKMEPGASVTFAEI